MILDETKIYWDLVEGHHDDYEAQYAPAAQSQSYRAPTGPFLSNSGLDVVFGPPYDEITDEGLYRIGIAAVARVYAPNDMRKKR